MQRGSKTLNPTDYRGQSCSTSPSNASNRDSGTNKRRRIALACSACRARKSRCDGNRPKCSSCEELSFECLYVSSASSNNVIVGREYLVGLEDRLTAVEASVRSLNDMSKAPAACPVDEIQPRRVRFDTDIDGSYQNGDETAVHGSIVTSSTGFEEATDGMGAITFSAEKDCGFYGPSSNISFIRHIARAVARNSQPRHPSTTTGDGESMQTEGGLMSVSRPPSIWTRTAHNKSRIRKGDTNVYSLPPEDQTLKLIHHYFSDTGLLFPFIHKEAFLETYAEIKHNRGIRKTWLGLLNMVLALATSTSHGSNVSAEKRAEEGDVYYQRANDLCDTQTVCGTSLEGVQYLLLLSQYLQSTQKSVQTWTIHGLAVKAALQLGLHSSEASRGFPPLEREVRKRTWYGCVILDRTLSMTFGRPAAIPDNYVKLDLPADYDVAISPSPVSDTESFNSICFFNATIKLYKIMWNIIDVLYGGNIGCNKPTSVIEIVEQLFKMEHSLGEWTRQLPAHMGLIKSQEVLSDNEEFHPVYKFRVILTLRYHNLRILNHRPVLVRFIENCGGSTSEEQDHMMLQQLGPNSIQICVESAMEIILIVSLVVHSSDIRRTFLGAWWFSLYYTFNAALVIFATILVCRKPMVHSPGLPLSFELCKKSLDEAIEALGLLDEGNRMVETCSKYLQKLGRVLYPLSSNIAGPGPSSPKANHLILDEPIPPNDGDTVPIDSQINPDGSPMGLDLGEFTIEGGLDFLNDFYYPVGPEQSASDYLL